MQKLTKKDKKKLKQAGILIVLAILLDVLSKVLSDGSKIGLFLKVLVIIGMVIVCYIINISDNPDD